MPRISFRLVYCLVALLWLLPGTGLSRPAADADAPGKDPEAEQRRQRLATDRDALQQTLQSLQGEYGVYSPNLVEVYSDLGALNTELGDYTEAARVYSEALQLTRINEGLYSERQLPIINALIDSYQALESWDEADDLAHLEWHIQSRLYAKDDPRYLLAGREYASWRLQLLQENLLGLSRSGHLDAAAELSDLYDDLLLSLEQQQAEHSEENDEDELGLLYGKSQADLTLARAVAAMPYYAFNGTVSRYITQTRCRNTTNAQGQVVRQCSQVRVENPRYRQSQRQAKRFALDRHRREVAQSIDRMQQIRDSSQTLSAGALANLDGRIEELELESRELRRTSLRSTLF